MPRLLVKFFGDPGEDICELEEAKYLLDFTDRIVMVDGQEIRSYDELVKIVNLGKYRDRDFIEIVQIPAIMGG
jgi:PDZ domain-containing secreted protein